MTYILHRSLSLLLIIFTFANFSFGQEKSVLVERCKALDQSSPIHNIWVDADNIKWVANGNGLNKVLALDVVEKVSVPAGTTSLLMIRGGNAQVEWNTAQMDQLLKNAPITCAFYNEKTGTVWMGTKTDGAFEISLSPLKIVQQLNTDNKRLTSNQINDIFIRQDGSIFIATNDGMLTGSGSKWTLQERYLNFIGVDAWGDNLWILGDNFLWQVDSKGKWSPIAIELRNVEGRMSDIAVDDEGRVWIASNMMTGYDVAEEKYQRFGPGQYFTSQFVNCLDVDHDGSIWTGTADKGLYLIQWESSLILTIKQDNALDCMTDVPAAALSVVVAGGQAPYKYLWNNGQTTEKISKLPSGEYSVTVTDANGLTKIDKYNIPDPAITVTLENITPSTNPSQPNGSATAVVSGGTGQYIYTWDNGELTPTATKLSYGNHSITVTDKSGCSAVASITVAETLSPLAVNVSIVKENQCGGTATGELRADVSGGKPPYQFSWNANSGKEAVLTSLIAGVYAVTITDATGKTATATKELKAPPALNVSGEIMDFANANAANGQAQVKVSGGVPPYSYAWTNGETSAINKKLAAGENIITVTDANGCTSTAMITMIEKITVMEASIAQSGDIKCAGEGEVQLTVEYKGGKPPYQYAWNNGATTQSIQNVKAGSYQVTVMDALGSSVVASSVIKDPEAIIVTITPESPASANNSDGRATAKATGGTGNYNYTWDTGETSNKADKLSAGKHSVTVTDDSGCNAVADINISENILDLQVTINQTAEIMCANQADAAADAVVIGGKGPFTYKWSTGASQASLSSLKNELLTVTVTDAVGHTATSALAIDAPMPLTININVESAASTNESNGRAIATVSGGKGKYSYLWDNGEQTERAEKLNAGTHKITVTDANGCTIEGSVTISENILPLDVELAMTGAIKCAGQKTASLTTHVKGGKPPFIYAWSGMENGSATSINNIGAGTYTVRITDAAGTVKTALFEVTEPKPLEVTVDKMSPASTGNADGEVILKVSGGTLPYTFRNTVLPNTQSLITIDQLHPGPVSFTITDNAGCTAEASATVKEEILPLTASIKETKAVLCTGAANGTLEVSVKGGKAPYSYAWSTGDLSGQVTNAAAGKYSVTVKDATGLETKAEHEVIAPAPMIVQVVNLRSATNDRINDGKGSLEIKNGTAPFSYSWSSGETSSNASQLPLGQGKVTVTDQNGCTATAEYIVKEKVLPELTASRLASGEPIRMEKIQFEADSVNINPEAIPSLDELYEFLYDNPTTIIEVAGHTNGLPADEYCDRISAERAQEVAGYLIGKGIESRRVISKGYGKRKPIATNQTPEGRKKNQRVEIRLIKIEE